MDIKEFKVGQTAFMVDTDTRGRTENSNPVTKVTVTKVGRKYITVEINRWRTAQFSSTRDRCGFLTENIDYGYPHHLFSSEEAYAQYVELEKLRRWLYEISHYGDTHKYTLDQLRAVKEILEPDNK